MPWFARPDCVPSPCSIFSCESLVVTLRTAGDLAFESGLMATLFPWKLVLSLGCPFPLLFDDPYRERFVRKTLKAGRLPTMTAVIGRLASLSAALGSFGGERHGTNILKR